MGLTKTLSTSHLENSLHEFVKEAWHVIEPRIPYTDNWHIKMICDHLEAVYRGQIKKLLANVPPGTSKSLLVQVFFPAWVWTRWHDAGFLFGCYSQRLANILATKCRDLVTSDWYQLRWGKNVHLRQDSAKKEHFQLISGGFRIATTPTGVGTGVHPDFLIFDDPHNVSQAESDLERETANEWWKGTIQSRGLTRGARQVGIMQRLHAEDLSAQCIAEKDWEVLIFPMEFEPGRMQPTCLGMTDPRTEEGELLWPELFDEAKVKDIKNRLGPYGTAGQLQQRPAPAEGGMFDAKLFRYYQKHKIFVVDRDEDVLVLNLKEGGERRILEKDCYWFQTIDTATKTTEQNAYTVVGTFLLTPPPVCLIVYDIYRARIPVPEQYAQVIAQRFKFPRVISQYVEEQASGIGLIQQGRNSGTPFKPLRTGRADKGQRAEAVSIMYNSGLVFHPAASNWVADLEGELLSFPNSTHKDQVDVMAYAGHVAQCGAANRSIVGRSLVLWPNTDYSPTDLSKLSLPNPEESKYNFGGGERQKVLEELMALGRRGTAQVGRLFGRR